MKKNLFVRVDTSPEIGTGHILRCVGLADELRNTFENDENYIIIDEKSQDEILKKWKNLKPANLTERYSSDKVDILTKEELKEILLKEGFFNGN